MHVLENTVTFDVLLASSRLDEYIVMMLGALSGTHQNCSEDVFDSHRAYFKHLIEPLYANPQVQSSAYTRRTRCTHTN